MSLLYLVSKFQFYQFSYGLLLLCHIHITRQGLFCLTQDNCSYRFFYLVRLICNLSFRGVSLAVL